MNKNEMLNNFSNLPLRSAKGTPFMPEKVLNANNLTKSYISWNKSLEQKKIFKNQDELKLDTNIIKIQDKLVREKSSRSIDDELKVDFLVSENDLIENENLIYNNIDCTNRTDIINAKHTINVKEMPLNPFDFIWHTQSIENRFGDNASHSTEIRTEENFKIKLDNTLKNGIYKTTNEYEKNWSFSSSNPLVLSSISNISSRFGNIDTLYMNKKKIYDDGIMENLNENIFMQ
jgi:hypothetical protein